MTVGQNVELTISGNAITTNASAALHFINGSPVTLMNNVMNSMGALGVKGTNSIAHLAAFENAVGAGSLFDFNPTNGISSNAFGAGGLGINVAAPTSPLDVYAAGGARIRLRTPTTPAHRTDSLGNVGDIAWDDNFVYVKTGSGGWKRTALTTF